MVRIAATMIMAAMLLGALTTCGPTSSGQASSQPTIVVDTSTTYQSISGWEETAFVGDPDSPVLPRYKEALLDGVVKDVGINRLRVEIRSGVENNLDFWTMQRTGQIDYQTWRCVRYATVNDNSDPSSINSAGFQFSELDWGVENIVLPLRQRLEARGEKLFVNLTYVAFTAQIRQAGCDPSLRYIHNQPEEYAEFVLAASLHLKSKYNLIPDAWEIILEPDNVGEWNNGTILGNAIKATATKLEANGLSPRFIVPATTSMANAPAYFDAIAQVLGNQGIGKYVKEIAYHRYAGVSDSTLQAIASRAVQYGIDTSMLEWWDPANGYQTLHKDLKMGRNSAWQQGTILGVLQVDESDPNNPVVRIPDATKFLRQYFKFIRAGARRIGATASDGTFDPLAFVNTDGKYVVVVKAAAGGAFSLQGLPAGAYGIKYTTAQQYDVNLPDASLGEGQPLAASIPSAGVLTIYAKPNTAAWTDHIYLPVLLKQ